MVDILDENGLEISTLSELIANLSEEFKTIYGSDINLESNSPDGQILNIFSQAGIDLRELLVAINNSFDPDQATGSLLDSRCALNNIERNAGSFTIQPIEITVDREVSLQGLDSFYNDIDGQGYTVSDDAGNEFILIDSITLETAGTYELDFRAADIGQIETTINTIVNQVSYTLGVTNVNNPSSFSRLGTNEETDVALRLRREQSVAIASQGYIDGLIGALLNLDDVTDAKVYENVEDTIDSNGIPAHGSWSIIEGGLDEDIAEAIYAKKSVGSPMKGDEIVNISTANGSIYQIKFDRPNYVDLYIKFEIQPVLIGTIFDQDEIKEYIVDNKTYKIGQYADTASLTQIATDAIINSAGETGVPINLEIGILNGTGGIDYYDYLEPENLDDKWVLDINNIDIVDLST